MYNFSKSNERFHKSTRQDISQLYCSTETGLSTKLSGNNLLPSGRNIYHFDLLAVLPKRNWKKCELQVPEKHLSSHDLFSFARQVAVGMVRWQGCYEYCAMCHAPTCTFLSVCDGAVTQLSVDYTSQCSVGWFILLYSAIVWQIVCMHV